MEIKIIPISEIKPYPNNPRINEGAVDVVAASLLEFGFQQPIVVDFENVVIVGHTRLKAALKIGLFEVPVTMASELSEDQVKAYRLADNKTGEYAEWDLGALRIELNDLKSKEYDISVTGFNIRDLALLGETMQKGQTDPDEIPEDTGPAKVKMGQLWKLGSHRLLCGDSTRIWDFNFIMDGAQADMIITDPPYNVNYQGGTEDQLTIENDDMSDEDFYQFLNNMFDNCVLSMKEGAPIYVFYASSESKNFYNAYIDSGLLFKQELIWVKNSMVLGRQDYQWQHEPIMYGWKAGAAHKWYGDFDKKTTIDDEADVRDMDKKELIKMIRQLQNDRRTTIIREDKPKRNDIHPTMKPVALLQNFILNSSEKDDIVLDPFGGSGSTLMTCETLYRECRTIEYDPKYCDVIISRWENFTGRKAELLKEGE